VQALADRGRHGRGAQSIPAGSAGRPSRTIRQVGGVACDWIVVEAATPLRQTSVRTLPGDRVAVDGLVVDDVAAARLVREREERGEDPAKVIVDAVEIGARVLDREQAGANADFVQAEMERAARELNEQFVERARTVSDQLQGQLEQVFGPDSGHLTKALERHFSDGSSAAVQHRVRDVVVEVMAKSREELARQFSADDGRNPLAGFQKGAFALLKQTADQQDANLRALLEKLAALERELQGLRDERDKQLALAAVEERGTAKGRTFEEAVYEALDEIAAGQGDTCEAVGDLRGAAGKTGDVVVGVEGCGGPPRARIVFEAKSSRLTQPKALAELDEAMADRDADFAVLVVSSEDKVPARMLSLREYGGDKLIVSYDPAEDSGVALRLAYALARARVLMARGSAGGVDAAAVADTVTRAINAMGEVRRVKSQLTTVSNGIDTTRGLVEALERSVLEHLERLRGLLAEASESAANRS
jgi:uncharacterized coiled-coil protein SlyX